MDISNFLEAEKDEILRAACTAMDRSHLQHYERDGVDKTRQRISTLYTLAKRCVKDRNLAPMVAHAEQIATERFNAGFDLWEVQTAFNVLEETLWIRVFQHFPPGELAHTLGLISTVLGAGKDTLARKYVSLASKTRVQSLNLQSLFAGSGE